MDTAKECKKADAYVRAALDLLQGGCPPHEARDMLSGATNVLNDLIESVEAEHEAACVAGIATWDWEERRLKPGDTLAGLGLTKPVDVFTCCAYGQAFVVRQTGPCEWTAFADDGMGGVGGKWKEYGPIGTLLGVLKAVQDQSEEEARADAKRRA